jgi:hypothetical protein
LKSRFVEWSPCNSIQPDELGGLLVRRLAVRVTLGVDPHADQHVAVAPDEPWPAARYVHDPFDVLADVLEALPRELRARPRDLGHESYICPCCLSNPPGSGMTWTGQTASAQAQHTEVRHVTSGWLAAS